MKSQVAAETLVVYGFVLLFFATAVAVMSYVGILDFSVLPEKCIFPAGIDCIDKPRITTTEMTLALKNNIGKLVVSDLQLGSCSPTGKVISIGKINATYSDLPVTVPFKEVFRIKISCNFVTGKIKDTVKITYSDIDSGLTHMAMGEITGSVVYP